MLINKGVIVKPCNGLETNRAPSNRSRWKGWEVDKKAGAKQFQAQYKTSRSMLPSSAECQPHQASGVQFLGNNTCPYLAPNKIRWDLGIPVVQFSPDWAFLCWWAEFDKSGKAWQNPNNHEWICLSWFRVGNICPVRQCLSGRLLLHKQFNTLSFQTPMNAFI